MSKQQAAEMQAEQDIPSAKAVNLKPLQEVAKTGNKLLDGNFSIIAGLKVTVEVVVGSAELTVDELFALEKGSTFSLDQLHNAPLVVRLDGSPIATGSLVVIEENFGIKIDDILAAPAVAASK
ncbi:FliM/FliN family flagellar motor C-terminal domain-containing protein [Methylobacillus pratensis]